MNDLCWYLAVVSRTQRELWQYPLLDIIHPITKFSTYWYNIINISKFLVPLSKGSSRNQNQWNRETPFNNCIRFVPQVSLQFLLVLWDLSCSIPAVQEVQHLCFPHLLQAFHQSKSSKLARCKVKRLNVRMDLYFLSYCWQYLTFSGALQASATTSTQSALPIALLTFFIIILSSLCISFLITPGVS